MREDKGIDVRAGMGHLFFMQGRTCTTRFAPSPSGHLHLGHAFAALEARRLADRYGGECLLRIEDIDGERSRQEFVEAIIEDMAWLGIPFDGEVLRQSGRTAFYREGLEHLKKLGVLYPCFCTRSEIARELALMTQAPQGEVIDPYPGTCRCLSADEQRERIEAGRAHSWRLDCRRGADLTGPLEWHDLRFGDRLCRPEAIGDIILGRKDCPASYHVAVVIDDAAQGVTHVTRGEDLLQSTDIHRFLQELWKLPVPLWYHHDLVRDGQGRRLAKRDKSLSIRQMRGSGMTAKEILACLESLQIGLT